MTITQINGMYCQSKLGVDIIYEVCFHVLSMQIGQERNYIHLASLRLFSFFFTPYFQMLSLQESKKFLLSSGDVIIDASLTKQVLVLYATLKVSFITLRLSIGGLAVG